MYPEAKFGLKITATEIAEGCWQILCCQQLFCHPAATVLIPIAGIWEDYSEIRFRSSA